MLDTEQEKRDFWASEEMWQDYMYQASMDSMWHHWQNEEWDEVRAKWRPVESLNRTSANTFISESSIPGTMKCTK